MFRPRYWMVGIAVVAGGMLALGVASANIYEQKYVVEAVITPLAGDQAPIKVSETWETIVYRDLARPGSVARVFGEALHFVYDGEDYFLLKRAANNRSAGAYDPLRECLGIKYFADYGGAQHLTEECRLAERTPMIVRVDADGRIERLSRPSSKHPYELFSIDVRVRPYASGPSYELAARFPWIADLPLSEGSLLPNEVPEQGAFVPAKYYQKDFVVQE